MLRRFRAWVKQHRKGVCITLFISTAGVMVFLINGKKVNLSLDELFSGQCHGSKKVPISPVVTDAIQKATTEAPVTGEPIVLEIAYRTFPRAEHIRRLSGGRKASAEKLLQAAEEGIDLLPGETLVNKCMVSRRVA